MEKPVIRLPDDELERLLADLESDRVERTESFRGDAPTAVREAVEPATSFRALTSSSCASPGGTSLMP